MPAADLRALAERLEVLLVCWCDAAPLPEEYHCPVCDGTIRRLPTEAEVRAAIFEAGYGVTIYARRSHATVEARTARLFKSLMTSAHEGEADPADLVLLALLRALEGMRRNG